MLLQHFYVGCLSQGSYLLGDEVAGEAIVVDPRRDVQVYLDAADAAGVRIVGVVNTHFHADFAAGHLELADATGAWIGYGEGASAEYPVRTFADGDRIRLGEVEVEVLATPGHTWESISLLVRPAHGAAPTAVLTGDALFVGDVGRPDLAASVGGDPIELARAQHRTIQQVLGALPDDVAVLPAHGAGSACGRSLSDRLASTIGEERHGNWALQPMTRDAFVAELLAGQPSVPAYFPADAVLNRVDHPRWAASPAPRLDADRVRRAMDGGAVVVDARDADAFAARHLAGSLNIGLDGRFAETAGMFVGLHERVVVLAPGRGDEAAMRLARVGIDRVVGVVDDVDALLDALRPRTASSPRYDVAGFDAARASGAVTVLDVRGAAEAALGMVPDALHVPLAELDRRIGEVPTGRRVAVHCAAGWRSSVAASALRAAGFDAVDLRGGYQDWAVEHAPARMDA